MTILHILFSSKAEGCPRLALDLIDQQLKQTGCIASVAFLETGPIDLLDEFRTRCKAVNYLWWRPKGFIGLFLRTLSLLRTARPTAVICYTLGHHVPIALAARILGIPIVVHVGCMPPEGHRLRRKLGAVMKAGAPFVSMHVACSEVVASACRELYGLKKVRCIPNGINLQHFWALRGVAPETTRRCKKVFGIVGSLAPSRDHWVLIEAMAVLKRRGAECRLVIAGSGTELERLQALAEELNVTDSIEWLGNVSDVRVVLSAIDVFTFATPSEGLGIAIVEAMTAGVPVVASDVPACREVLEGGRWGRLVHSRDAEAWADALIDDSLIAIPPLDVLSRYDVCETWRAYAAELQVK